MGSLRVFLLGRFAIVHEGADQTDQFPRRAQELFCYLLMSSGKPHLRENLVDALWSDESYSQPRKVFRHVLWQLHTSLGKLGDGVHDPPLTLEGDWVSLNPRSCVACDVVDFELAINEAHQAASTGALEPYTSALRKAVNLYMGDLLPAWYCDWCLRERERLQILYLSALDQLVDCCEAQQSYDEGLTLVERILQIDAVHERAYQQLMRLHYYRGDRASAVRQYERCASVLQAELHISPGRQTQALLEQIRDDRLSPSSLPHAGGPGIAAPIELNTPAEPSTPADVLMRLLHLQNMLAEAQSQLARDLCALQSWLRAE
ncbi:MAG TPA: BTAD domain-containing putative transcriptional regulator [Anaerolineae bacterium]